MSQKVRIMAFESSCDETSVAIVEDGQTILANVVASQVQSHIRFGGVVPAARLRDAVDSDVSGLDGDARLCAVLHQARQLEELAEPDASGH